MEKISGPVDSPVKPAPSADALVAAALNGREMKWFFGADGASGLQSQGLTPVSAGGDGDEPTAQAVMALNPEVLLTCWSTPFLPEAWLESRECRVRYICHLTGSVRHVVSRRFLEHGGLVTNWGGIPSTTVAEQALLLALASLRNLGRWSEVFDNPADTSRRVERLQTRTLVGRRIGIHGFGQVARALVQLLAPFKVLVSAHSPGVPAEQFAALGVRQVASLPQLFAGSDVVFECEALTPRTSESVGAAELAALRDGGVLVNVARAGLINDAALLHEANSGRIRVALDVFSAEPLPLSSSWRRAPGVVLSPHIAGPTFDQYAECAQAALANVQRYFAKQPLQSIVTTEVYDRST